MPKQLADVQMEIYELLQLCRYEQNLEDNVRETIKTVHSDYPELDLDELTSYVSTKAEEIYMGEYDEFDEFYMF